MANKDITIYGDGSQTRTFCYIEDNVDACLAAFYDNKYVNDVVNVGGADELAIVDLAKLVIKVTNSKSNVVHHEALEEGDMTRRQPDTEKMKKLLKREPITLEEGMKRIIENPKFIL